MEFKKRKADLQLTAENYEEEATYGGETPVAVSGSCSSETKLDSATKVEEEKPAAQSGGFLAYAKSNPFAAAMNNSGQNSFASTPLSSFGAISASRSSFNMPPPLVLPSPKSPKANPFSSPSPANTQFVTIVDNNDDLWKAMANDKLSADEAVKSDGFSENKGKKSPVYRSSFFGSNGHGSSFASVSANAATAPASVFGSSTNNISSGNTSTGAPVPVQVQAAFGGASSKENDASDGENDENDDNDGDDNTGAGQASMKIISLPENVKLVTGEEEDVCLLQFRAKLYRLHTGAAPLAPVVASSSSSSSSGATLGALEVVRKSDAEVPVLGALQRQDSSYESDGPSSTTTTTTATATASSVLLSVIQEKETAKHGGKVATVAAKAAEWVEVGIGPLKILSSKAGGEGVGESVMSGRLVMRREDKQGGLGEPNIVTFAAVIGIFITIIILPFAV